MECSSWSYESYCWWFRNPANSPVEVGSLPPLFTLGLYIPGGAGFLPPRVFLIICHLFLIIIYHHISSASSLPWLGINSILSYHITYHDIAQGSMEELPGRWRTAPRGELLALRSPLVAIWWWQCKWFFIFTPILGEDEPILTCIFFKWVVQPPTRIVYNHPFFFVLRFSWDDFLTCSYMIYIYCQSILAQRIFRK